MNTPFNFYAIRVVGTNLFKNSRHNTFGSYEQAIGNGVFFNQRKSAEKQIRDAMKQLKGHPDYPAYYSRYTLYPPENPQGEPKMYSAIPEYVTSVTDYPVELRDIELEVVTLSMSVA
jgi:hypothetical protein